MFICEVWLFDWYFPQFCKSDMSKYGYLEGFQRVPSISRYRESTVYCSAQFNHVVIQAAVCDWTTSMNNIFPFCLISLVHSVGFVRYEYARFLKLESLSIFRRYI